MHALLAALHNAELALAFCQQSLARADNLLTASVPENEFCFSYTSRAGAGPAESLRCAPAVWCTFRDAVALEQALREACGAFRYVSFIGRFDGILISENMGEFLDIVRQWALGG